MKVIYKYIIEIEDEILLEIPQHAQILSIQTQKDKPCIWAVVETDNPIVKRNLKLIGTGHEIKNYMNCNFIGTFQVHDGAGVFHLFEFYK